MEIDWKQINDHHLTLLSMYLLFIVVQYIMIIELFLKKNK